MLEVWGRRISGDVIPVMWTIGELGLDHTRHLVGGSFGGLDTDEYRALNPNRRIPTLRDDGRVLWESNTIIRYLAARYGEGTLCPSDPYQRALAGQWLEWTKTTVLAHLTTVFFGNARVPIADRDAGAIAAGARGYAAALEIVEDQLGDRAYLLGDQLTMADITLGAYAYRYYNVPVEHPSLPRVEAWYARLCARPAYQTHVMIPFGRTPEEFDAREREEHQCRAIAVPLRDRGRRGSPDEAHA